MEPFRRGDGAHLGAGRLKPMRRLWTKLRAKLTGEASPERELDAEIESHLRMAEEDCLASGMSPAEAQAAARRQFGNVLRVRERARDEWGFPAVESVLGDVRHGLRGLRRTPSFALTVILTLALGIGATTAIFSVVDAVLLRPLPYPDAERLVWLQERTPREEGMSVTWLNYQAWVKSNHSFEDMAAFTTAHRTLTGKGEPALLRAGVITSHFSGLVGMRPLLGRLFRDADDVPGAPPTVVVSERFWSTRLAGDRHALGATLILDGQAHQIIGVASPLEFFSKTTDCYLPLGAMMGGVVRRSAHGSIRVLGRLRPGVRLEAAQADLDRILEHLAEVDPGPENDHRAAGSFMAAVLTERVRPSLLLMLAAVGLVLLIACANVASLTLARGTVRGGEVALRMAIGASRGRIGRQLLTENLVVAGLGGTAGIAFAQGCLHALLRLAPTQIPRLADTALDLRVLLFAATITMVTGALVGLAPIVATQDLDLGAALKEGGRAVGQGRGGQTFRNILVAGEIAVTLVLAFSSGLLLRTLSIAQNSSPGFVPDQVLAAELVLPTPSYSNGEAARRFYGRLISSVRQLPGVTAVGAVACPPAVGGCMDWFYSLPGRPAPPPDEKTIAFFNVADPDYFRTMRIPLLEGRSFQDSDRGGSPAVAIVNATFARRWWPGRSAIGRHIKIGNPNDEGAVLEVVGVAGDVSQRGLDAPTLVEIYQPFAQQPSSAMVMMVRSSGPPQSLANAVRRRLAEIDRNVPIQSLQSMPQRLAGSLERRRFGTLLLVIFALLAMLLAAVGVFGLLDYWVRARESELALRAALGASRRRLISTVARRLLPLIGAGAAAGTLGAAAASRGIESLVYGVSPRDPGIFAAAILLVVAIAVAGAAAPAWRAAHVEPQRKLHHG
jgi:predicted permease